LITVPFPSMSFTSNANTRKPARIVDVTATPIYGLNYVQMMVDGASIRERLRDLVVAFTFTTGVFGIAHVLHWLPSHNVTGGRKLVSYVMLIEDCRISGSRSMRNAPLCALTNLSCSSSIGVNDKRKG
jgi:hypothetical protein